MSNKVTAEKINVRSPFFITANNEGAPPLPSTPTDPVSNPTVPAEYVEPTTFTETVQCGQTVKIGEDVGARIYKLNVGSATGNVTVNYTVNVPVSITGYFNTTVPSTIATDFVGSDAYQQQLLDAGIASGGMSLTSGVATGSVTVNKTTASPETVEILVFAPLKTFDYQLTFNCPTAPSVSAPTGSLPAVPSHTGFVEQIPAFKVNMPIINNEADLQLRVNGTLVKNITQSGWYVFTDFPTAQSNFGIHRSFSLADVGATIAGSGFTSGLNGCVSAFNTRTEYFAQSTYFTQGVNNITFQYTPKIRDTFSLDAYNNALPEIAYAKTGLFYDNIASVFRYPLYSGNDSQRFDWTVGSPLELNAQNDNKVHLFKFIKPTKPAVSSYYYGGPFGYYQEVKKHSIEFHWQSTSPAGLDNPTRGTNSYFQQFAGRTYRELYDDGIRKQESAILSTLQGDGVLGCFT